MVNILVYGNYGLLLQTGACPGGGGGGREGYSPLPRI